MSARAIAWAMDARRTGPVGPVERLVLVVLADFADPDGAGAFPSKATLADRLAPLSERQIQRHLVTLREADLIRPGDDQLVSHYRADRRPTVYDLALTERGGVHVTPSERGDIEGRNGETPTVERGGENASQTKNGTKDLNPTPLPPSVAQALDAMADAMLSPAEQVEVDHRRRVEAALRFEYPDTDGVEAALMGYEHALAETVWRNMHADPVSPMPEDFRERLKRAMTRPDGDDDGQ